LPGLAPAEGAPGPRKVVRGVYRSSRSGRVVELSVKDDRQAVSLDAYDLPFVPANEGGLKPMPEWQFINQNIHWSGEAEIPQAIWLEDHGVTDELQRVKPAATSDPSMIVGRYVCESIRTQIIIHSIENKARLKTSGPFGASVDFTLEPLGEELWRAKSTGYLPWGGILSFDPHHRSFRFFSARTRDLAFQRDGQRP
jgi:hypothetical protein